MYQISSESREFSRRYYEKQFGLIFSRHTVVQRGCVDIVDVFSEAAD